MKKIAFALPVAALALVAFTIGATAQQQQAQRNFDPRDRAGTYGPTVYSEGGRTVHVPRNCYASREQVRVGGQLIWRPLVTCPYDDYR